LTGAGEANAAGYWAGRAWVARGDTARAHARWREVIARSPDSYYATAAARRLDLYRLPAGVRDSSRSAPRPAALDSAARRIALLQEIGLDQEAGWELDALAAARGGPDTLLAVAATLVGLDEPARGARVARAALAAGADSAAALHLLFPVAAPDVLVHQARERGVDPALAAALIRQESGFDPDAVSAAGARGLMQVMPAVGAAIARRLHYPIWDPVLLFQPDVNLELGLAHLQRLLAQFPRPEQLLAAYNAGGSKVRQWEGRHGTADPEVFIERIPFAETRDYVRIVLRDREVYRWVLAGRA
jgi:soluble lytic murein transglycosylase